MKFGLFVAPFHKMGENPTLCYERDLETVEWAERLGYDEVFVGEHHSAGWEIIPSPEVFIANAAARTKSIRLGTGVSIVYSNQWSRERRDMLVEKASVGVAAAFAAAGENAPGLGAGEPVATASASLPANGGKAAK